MSLQHAAKHLEKHGRNGDTVLVHMSKGEVKSLNDLAMANGGYLTINPHTGLPEAGFLQRMLPMVIGAGLVATGVGAPAAAMMVGGGYFAATGSLKQGLMAGLGAYGGAGMASSFGAAGASSVVPEAAASSAGDLAALTPTAPVAPIAVDPTAAVNPMSGNFSTATASPPVDPNLAVNPLSGRSLPAPVVSASPAPVTPPVDPNLAVNPLSGRLLPAPVTPTVEVPVTATAPAPVNPNLPPEITSNSPSFQQQPGDFKNMTASQRLEAIKSGASFDNLGDWASKNKVEAYGMGASAIMPWDEEKEERTPPYRDSDPGQQFTYEANATQPTPIADPYGREQKYFNPRYVKRAADGGITGSGNLNLDIPLNLTSGGGGYSGAPAAAGGSGGGSGATYPFQNNGGFTGNNNAPQVAQQAPQVSQNLPNANQPTLGLGASQEGLFSGILPEQQDFFAAQSTGMASGGMATGGIFDAGYNLGGYSDGGRLLRGPGDGVSDSIPAVIGKRQPARLADGEFVIPARIVSELGNGSTEAGARKLYAMMDRIQKTRGKTVGKGKVAKNSRADKHLPA
jgi:hypothetical protein